MMGANITKQHLEQLFDYLCIIEYEGHVYPYTLADQRHSDLVAWVEGLLLTLEYKQ